MVVDTNSKVIGSPIESILYRKHHIKLTFEFLKVVKVIQNNITIGILGTLSNNLVRPKRKESYKLEWLNYHIPNIIRRLVQ